MQSQCSDLTITKKSNVLEHLLFCFCKKKIRHKTKQHNAKKGTPKFVILTPLYSIKVNIPEVLDEPLELSTTDSSAIQIMLIC